MRNIFQDNAPPVSKSILSNGKSNTMLLLII